MPNTSRNPSSEVPKPHPDPQTNYIQPAKSPDSTELVKQTDATDDTQNWFSGTEELLDALPKVWTRSSLYLLVAFAVIVLPWAMFSKVDETESARGRIEPKGATQKLDSPVGASVTVVNVKEGDTVKSGQVLLEMDSEVLKTELKQVQTKLDGLQNRRKNSELLKNQLTLSLQTQQQQNQSQLSAKQSQVEQVRRNLDALKALYNLQKDEKQAKVEQVKQALNSSKAAQKLAEVRFRASQEKVPRYRKAYQDGVMSQERFNEVEQLAKEDHERLIQAQSDIAQVESSLKEQQSSYQKTMQQARFEIDQAELRFKEEQRNYQSLVHTGQLAQLKAEEQIKELQSQIDSLQSDISQTQSQLAASNIQLQQRVVRSPIDGVIFEFPTTKPGAVLQPGQRVAQVAPLNVDVVLKAQIPNQSSGFLKAGMPVKVKFDAYPFQEYGIVSGKVKWISPDSKIQQTPQGNVETFELEITLNQQYIQSGKKRIQFLPGQSATAEVIIRQRRIIDFILDPFKKLHKGGLNA